MGSGATMLINREEKNKAMNDLKLKQNINKRVKIFFRTVTSERKFILHVSYKVLHMSNNILLSQREETFQKEIVRVN